MKKTLRPYQSSAIQSLFDWLYTKEGNPLVVAPVGAGKSLLIADFIKHVHDQFARTRIVVLTHVKELLVQNADELKQYYPDCDYGFYCAGLGQKRLHNDVTFASIQSVHSKIAAFNRCPEIIIIDECHLISHNDQTQYRKFIDSAKEINPNIKVIGFTGTPFRSDTGRLDEGNGRLFDGVAYEISMKFMIDEGYWARPVMPNSVTRMSVDGVGSRGGDYIAGQLEAAVDVDETTQKCVAETIEHTAERKKVLVFTAGVKHCEHVRDEFRRRGQSAEMITGDTEDTERNRIITDYKAGKFKYLINVAVLTTGFNVPDIDCLVFMRPTKSPVLYIQTTGRGVRPVYATGYDLNTREGRLASIAASVKPDCLILDFGGVVATLGPIDSVDIRKKSGFSEGDGTGEAIVKRCPSCGEFCASAQRYCYNCSYSFISDALSPTAGNAAILQDDIPPEWQTVLGMNYTAHQKRGDEFAKPTMCVSYSTMSGIFKEWVCFEHDGYALDKARHWYKQHANSDDAPRSVDAAIKEKYYKIPRRILVKKDGKFWRIIDKDFIGQQDAQNTRENKQSWSVEDIPF